MRNGYPSPESVARGGTLRVIIIGGTGLLGSALQPHLVGLGHTVTVVSRHAGGRAGGPASAGVRWVPADIGTLDHAGLVDLVAGHDALVYALGPDDRVRAPVPSAPWFHENLAVRTDRVLTAAREAGTGAAVVLGSYFSTLDRDADAGLAQRHGYVAAREEQARRAIAAGGTTMRVGVLEVPWVFGVVPGVVPHWKALMYDPLGWVPLLPLGAGSTTVVSVDTVTAATGAWLAHGRHGDRVPVGDDDLTLHEIVRIAGAARRSRTRVIGVPTWLGEAVLGLVAAGLRLTGPGTGLDFRGLMRDVFGRRLVVDHASTRALLGLNQQDARAAIRASVRSCYPELSR